MSVVIIWDIGANILLSGINLGKDISLSNIINEVRYQIDEGQSKSKEIGKISFNIY